MGESVRRTSRSNYDLSTLTNPKEKEDSELNHRDREGKRSVGTFKEEHEQRVDQAEHPEDPVNAPIGQRECLEDAVVTVKPQAPPPQALLVEVVVNRDVKPLVIHEGCGGVKSVGSLAFNTIVELFQLRLGMRKRTWGGEQVKEEVGE